MSHTALTDDHRDTYRQNLVSALDAVGTALRDRRDSALDDEYIDLLNLYPQETTGDESAMTDYVEDHRGLPVDDFTRSYVDEFSPAIFVPEFLEYLEQAAEEYDNLLAEYDPVEVSDTTGMPVHRTDSHRHNGTIHIRQDALRFDEERSRVQSILKEYAMQKGNYEDVSWKMDGDTEWFIATKDDAVDVARQDLFSGTVPDTPQEQLERAYQLKGIEGFKPFAPGEKHVDVVAVDEDDDTVFFKLHMADYSIQKDDSLLFYGVGGHQEDDRGFFSFRSLPIRVRDEEYRIGTDLGDMMDAAFDWPPEKVLEQFNQLRERGVTNGDNVTATTAEMIRVGPYYTPFTDHPPEPDEAVEMAKDRYMTDRIISHPDAVEYDSFSDFLADHPDIARDVREFDSIEDVKTHYPATYATVELGEVLRDFEDASVLCVERNRAMGDGDPDTTPMEETELIFAAPVNRRYVSDADGNPWISTVADELEVRLENALDTADDRFTATVVPVPDYTPMDPDIDTYMDTTDTETDTETAIELPELSEVIDDENG